jgi:signal transduction histidine kinase
MAFQVFIENAIDALEGKGKIFISSVLAQYLDHPFPEYLEIEIADNGPGIPESIRDTIFEPFYTTKENGTGMGLVIARKIIMDHNGSLELISKDHFGTVFRIHLPVQRKNE